MNKRKLTVTAISIAAILVSGGTVVAASSFRTTAQKAAEASPPPPSEMTSVVVTRQLFDTVDLTCKVGFSSSESFPNPETVAGVITSSPLSDGDAVGDGTLISEINGSPVFAIIGAFPLYRDLNLGDAGPDARLINDALVRAGLLIQQSEPAASTVTPYTATALAALYVMAGYPAPKSGGPVIVTSMFRVLSAPGVVFGPVHGTGKLGSQPIATVGIGPRGLLCTSGGVSVPAEAKDGQSVRIPMLNSEPHPVKIVQINASAEVEEQAGPAASTTVPLNSGDTAAAVDKRALFVEVGDAVKGLGDVVQANLVLAQSTADPLVVPSAALWTKAGQTLITVIDETGSRDVPVVVEFSAKGENAVHVLEPAFALASGDKVVVTGAR